jgi:hypothetical protein
LPSREKREEKKKGKEVGSDAERRGKGMHILGSIVFFTVVSSINLSHSKRSVRILMLPGYCSNCRKSAQYTLVLPTVEDVNSRKGGYVIEGKNRVGMSQNGDGVQWGTEILT